MKKRRQWILLLVILPVVLCQYENRNDLYGAERIDLNPQPPLIYKAPVSRPLAPRGYQPPPHAAEFQPPRSYNGAGGLRNNYVAANNNVQPPQQHSLNYAPPRHSPQHRNLNPAVMSDWRLAQLHEQHPQRFNNFKTDSASNRAEPVPPVKSLFQKRKPQYTEVWVPAVNSVPSTTTRAPTTTTTRPAAHYSDEIVPPTTRPPLYESDLYAPVSEPYAHKIVPTTKSTTRTPIRSSANPPAAQPPSFKSRTSKPVTDSSQNYYEPPVATTRSPPLVTVMGYRPSTTPQAATGYDNEEPSQGYSSESSSSSGSEENRWIQPKTANRQPVATSTTKPWPAEPIHEERKASPNTQTLISFDKGLTNENKQDVDDSSEVESSTSAVTSTTKIIGGSQTTQDLKDDKSSSVSKPAEVNNIIVHIFLNAKDNKRAPAHASTKLGPFHGTFGVGTSHGGPGTNANPIVITKEFDRDRLRFVDEVTAEAMLDEGPANIVEVKAMVSSPDQKIGNTLNRAVSTELDRAIPVVLNRFKGPVANEMDNELRKELEQALVDEIAKNLGQTIDEMSSDVTEEDLTRLIEEGLKEFENDKDSSTSSSTEGTTPTSPTTSTPTTTIIVTSSSTLTTTEIPTLSSEETVTSTEPTTESTTITITIAPSTEFTKNEIQTESVTVSTVPSQTEKASTSTSTTTSTTSATEAATQATTPSTTVTTRTTTTTTTERTTERTVPSTVSSKAPTTSVTTKKPEAPNVDFDLEPTVESQPKDDKPSEIPSDSQSLEPMTSVSSSETDNKKSEEDYEYDNKNEVPGSKNTVTQSSITTQTMSTTHKIPSTTTTTTTTTTTPSTTSTSTSTSTTTAAPASTPTSSPTSASTSTTASTTTTTTASNRIKITTESEESFEIMLPEEIEKNPSGPKLSIIDLSEPDEDFETFPPEEISTTTSTITTIQTTPSSTITTTKLKTPPAPTQAPQTTEEKTVSTRPTFETSPFNVSPDTFHVTGRPGNLPDELNPQPDSSEVSEPFEPNSSEELEPFPSSESDKPVTSPSEPVTPPSEPVTAPSVPVTAPPAPEHRSESSESAETFEPAPAPTSTEHEPSVDNQPASSSPTPTPAPTLLPSHIDESTEETEFTFTFPPTTTLGSDVQMQPESVVFPSGQCPTPNDMRDKNRSDVLFLVDSSNTFNEKKFHHAITLIQHTVDYFNNIGPDGVQFSLVQYNNEPYLEFSLRKHNCKQWLLDDIADTEYMTGKNMLGKALDKVSKFAFTKRRGDRPEAENVLIILTGGEADDHIQQPVKVAKQNNMTVLVIATLEADPSYLVDLAGDTENVFQLDGSPNAPLAAKLAERIRHATSPTPFPEIKPSVSESSDAMQIHKHVKPVDLNDLDEEKDDDDSQVVTSQPIQVGREDKKKKMIHMDCTQEGFQITMNLPASYMGQAVVKGQENNPKCKKVLLPLKKQGNHTTTFFVSNKECGIQQTESTEPEGKNSTMVLHLVHDPSLRTDRDRAFLLQCFVSSSDTTEAEVSTNLDVVKNDITIAETISLSSVPPTCNYSIRKDSPNGPVITKATVGQTVYHRWECDGGDEANHVYGIQVHNCFASDDVEQKYPIVDNKGCSSDLAVLSDPFYEDEKLVAFAVSHAFGFKDTESLKFVCKLSLCTRDGDGCEGVSPPVCGKSQNITDLLLTRRIRHESTAIEKALTSALSTEVDLTSGATGIRDHIVGLASNQIMLGVLAVIVVGLSLTAIGSRLMRISSARSDTSDSSAEDIESEIGSPFSLPTSPSINESRTSSPFVASTIVSGVDPRMAAFMKDFDRQRYV